jgi:hypothetical protein
MKKTIALISLLFVVCAPAAVADETGFAGIHAWKKEKGRRICMADHFHEGSGVGKTRKEAEDVATRSWIEFTAFEYGTVWGNYKLAVSHTKNCRESATTGWSCMVSARPCKRHAVRGDGHAESASR